MTEGLASLVMDGLLLCFLAGAAFYAARLSVQLKVFRESRSELEKLVTNLSRSITQAENSIDALRATAQQAGLDLQDEINDARILLDELQIIVEAGEGIASRLEKGSSGARHQKRHAKTDASEGQRKAFSPEPVTDEMPDIFSIRDPEFESDYSENDDFTDDGFSFMDDGDSSFSIHDNSELSKAERDLYHALHGSKKRKTPVGGA